MKMLDPRLLARMPLAEAVLWAWRAVATPERLDAVFAAHRGGCYQRQISFPLFVRLIADALLEHQGSGHQAFTRGREAGQLPTSESAVYGKLRRMPIALSCGMLAELSEVQRQGFPSVALRTLPSRM